MTFRRMLPFLLLNMVVSAVVVLGILYWWEGREVENGVVETAVVATPVLSVPTAVAGANETFIDETPIPPPTSGPDLPVHIVAPGDTLGAIATLYDVPLDDLLTANGISNPNLLNVGDQLLIPVGGLPTPTPTIAPTETPNIAPSPIPTEPLTQGEVIIEISEVVAPGVLTEEAVAIVNSGTRPIALQGWQLRKGNAFVYTFEQITLFGEGAGLLIYTEAGIDTPLKLYWGLEEPLWAAGDTVTLVDAEGTTQATLTLPAEE